MLCMLLSSLLLALSPSMQLLQQGGAPTRDCDHVAPCMMCTYLAAADSAACLQSWRWQQNKRPAQSMGRPGVVKDEACSVYAGNLPWRASEDDLVAFFSPAGRVVDVRRRANDDGEAVRHAAKQSDTARICIYTA